MNTHATELPANKPLAIYATSFILKLPSVNFGSLTARNLCDALRSSRLWWRGDPPARSPLLFPQVRDGLTLERLSLDIASRLVGTSAVVQRVRAWITRVAPARTPALITGETGTGKEVVARALHDASGRRGEFIALNCASVSEHLLESELFGHRRGAFTGAASENQGLFQAAHRGTLFLDEIGEMPRLLQARLLRVLETNAVRMVGDTHERPVDVRIVAATNRPLHVEAARGMFRQDLYYRIAVARQHLAPLRDRIEDIDPLCDHWLSEVVRREGRSLEISRPARALLRDHSWPGNVRELRNVLEVSASLCGHGPIDVEHIRAAIDGEPEVPFDIDGVEAALRENRWHRGRTARQLGVSRTTLWRRLKASSQSTDPS